MKATTLLFYLITVIKWSAAVASLASLNQDSLLNIPLLNRESTVLNTLQAIAEDPNFNKDPDP